VPSTVKWYALRIFLVSRPTNSICTFVAVVLLGLQAIPLQGSAGDVRSSTQIRRRALSQLVLFVMGVLLMVIAIKF